MVQTVDNISEQMLLLYPTLPNLQRKCDSIPAWTLAPVLVGGRGDKIDRRWEIPEMGALVNQKLMK